MSAGKRDKEIETEEENHSDFLRTTVYKKSKQNKIQQKKLHST